MTRARQPAFFRMNGAAAVGALQVQSQKAIPFFMNEDRMFVSRMLDDNEIFSDSN
jgi:hypothetical protein